MKGYCYILTNKNKTVLYVGATNNLERRVSEHKNGKYKNAFTKKYNCTLLVYFEEFDTIKDSFKRERQWKAGNRKRKEKLINSINPEWNDLSESWFDGSKESF
ncbi:GIY-YIG nuclease family protein [Flavobacteriaceae bacterium GF1]